MRSKQQQGIGRVVACTARSSQSGGLNVRLLSTRWPNGALEFVETRPRGTSRGPPILFIHGAFGGAWMWSEIFMPYMAARGRYAAAVSLRGHGKSMGRHVVREATLADYAADVRRAFAEFTEPPIVVAHSPGALLAQRLLSWRSACLIVSGCGPLSCLHPYLLKGCCSSGRGSSQQSRMSGWRP